MPRSRLLNHCVHPALVMPLPPLTFRQLLLRPWSYSYDIEPIRQRRLFVFDIQLGSHTRQPTPLLKRCPTAALIQNGG